MGQQHVTRCRCNRYSHGDICSDTPSVNIIMVQIQAPLPQKPQHPTEEDHESGRNADQEIRDFIFERRQAQTKRQMSMFTSLMLLGTALMILMLLTRMVGSRLMWPSASSEVQVEIVSDGFGKEIDLSITCTFESGQASWTKECSCSGIFHCNCVGEITECMKGGGCAKLCWEKSGDEEKIVL